ncbi:MAG: nucleotide exchange factor GrpE [Sarcina sp.]
MCDDLKSKSDLEDKLISSERERKKLILINKLVREELLVSQKEVTEIKSELEVKEKALCEVAEKFIAVLDQLDDVYNVAIRSENKMLEKNMKSLKNIIGKEIKGLGIFETAIKGEKFDAKLHECIEAVDDKERNRYEIIEIVRRGYRVGNKVIRPAKVVVVK